ncbi:hypothetical protein [Marilutibacter alkalisoli]|uniref:Uncharacterized protein n=1 Tax=Marilutibacter alkalisoli TaxID=2591633 RepID=A0A514BU40_9GAMM|nr:hypothetical protein [Lysobacter alkalisoli]QDH70857.1 hypothetical protein FKV23_12760 [Lysobacter alkalisoli]
MSNTQQRLDAYYAAEARILARGSNLRHDQRQRQEAELADIRKAIKELEAKLDAENGKSSSAGSLRYKTAVFCK